MKCWFSHRWGFPRAEGLRTRSGQFLRTGADFQSCLDCGKRRQSPIQFESERDREKREQLEWLAT